MAKDSDKTSALEKVASFIVDKRKGFYLVYIVLIIFSIFSAGWVKVNNNITDYLSDETETRRGLDIMENEFITYATASVMIDNISYGDAEKLCDKLEDINGVKEIAFDDTDKHYLDGSALFSVTFDGESMDAICEEALDEIEEQTQGYDAYISAELGNSMAERIESEMKIIMVIACVIILFVLLFTSRTYMEVPVQIITFGVAALLNKGTNFMFGTISFISNSIAVVLQLALAIDYAIILCHRYTEERVTKDARDAVITALCKAIPEISGSCLTTLSGLAAMSFMQFEIGLDMSMVLIKAIIISILSVFTLMPGLLMSFSKLIDKTHHENFVPSITGWCNIVVKLRYITPCIFAVLAVVAFVFSNNCPYAYSTTDLTTSKKNDLQIANEMIAEKFTKVNPLAVVVPTGDYEKEQAIVHELELYPEVETITGLASIEAIDGYALGDKLTSREFSELTDIDIELVNLLYSMYAADQEEYGKIISGVEDYKIALIDMFDFVYEAVDEGYVSLDEEKRADLDDMYEVLEDGKKQLAGDEHVRVVMNLNIPEESPETYEFLDKVRGIAQKYYGDKALVVGNATSNFDLSSTFDTDNKIINVLSIVFVMLVLLFTFQSAGIPLILILVIQGSVWMNFSFPTIQHQPIYFMGYLVVSSIQMGANIDYAIVITNRYTELRKKMPKLEAIKQSLNLSFPTVFTSGSILASAGTAIGFLSSDPAISTIGSCLGRGTLISIALVMGILPQLLVLGDIIIEKTAFTIKVPIEKEKSKGVVSVDGYIRGTVNGQIEGNFKGKINGDFDANISNGTVLEKEEIEDEEKED